MPVRAFGELVTVLSCTGIDPSLACAALARAERLAPSRSEHAALSCEPPPSGRARLGILLGYGRPSHPHYPPEKPEQVSLAGGEEVNAERVRLTLDGAELDMVEVLDVDAAVRADFADGQQALVVHLFGQSGYAGGWSNVAWEGLPAHIQFATLDTSEGLHEISLQVRGQTQTRVVRVAAGTSRTTWFGVPW